MLPAQLAIVNPTKAWPTSRTFTTSSTVSIENLTIKKQYAVIMAKESSGLRSMGMVALKRKWNGTKSVGISTSTIFYYTSIPIYSPSRSYSSSSTKCLKKALTLMVIIVQFQCRRIIRILSYERRIKIIFITLLIWAVDEVDWVKECQYYGLWKGNLIIKIKRLLHNPKTQEPNTRE